MDYQYILFDLDGTITESEPGIVNSVCYALGKMGIAVADKADLKKFIGPPLVDSMRRFYQMSQEEAEQAVAYYREYYAEKGIFENAVYEGFAEAAGQLRRAGKVLAVATSKPEHYAKRIAEHFGIADLFVEIYGASMDASRLKKSDVIRYALEEMKIDESLKSTVLMVGDREHDVAGAKENGIDCMGVLYGYGDREELELAGADYIVETTWEIAGRILA